jgi:putative membrane protein
MMFSSLLLWATTPQVIGAKPWEWELLLWHITQVIVYVVLGLGLFALAYLVVQKMVPFSIRKEIEEDQNVALGVVLGSVFIGIAIILAAAIRG